MRTFQSRYRAASHFRATIAIAGTDYKDSFNLVIERLLISGAVDTQAHLTCLPELFQSRYRAASHFRTVYRYVLHWGYNVSISLSSGFSFQVTGVAGIPDAPSNGFNLVIERLLISGPCPRSP